MRHRFISLAFLLSAFPAIYASLPNPQVIAGQASFKQEGAHFSIQSSDRAVLHWEGFSLAKGETAHFQLPGEHAAILNRVMGGNPTEIYGQLLSNGQVYLINPQGIFIGKDAYIDTASFLASTLDCSTSDFLEGKELLFSADTKGLINEGTLIARNGDVILLGHGVRNQGSIQAGTIALGAGQEILYLPNGDERIQVALSASREEKDDTGVGIHQEGQLRAFSVQLHSDGNLYGYAIKSDGIIEADITKIFSEKGFIAHTGAIQGKEVQILGEHIRLLDEATIDVSQDEGGGTVLIGGDYQGKNPNILNAMSTFVDEGVVISANALRCGDGGKVIVWADDATGFRGLAQVRGGPEGGDGGFVEVSGKLMLDFWGDVDAGAPLGKNGNLLLDPTNVTIAANGGVDSAGVTFNACPSGTYSYTAITAATLDNALLSTRLGGTCNITVTTTSGGGGTGSIALNGAVTWASTNALTLTSITTLTSNASGILTSTGGGAINLNAGTALTIGAAINWSGTSTATSTLSAGNGALNVNAALTNNTTAGNLTLSATTTVTTAAAGTISSTSTGNLTINSGTGMTLGGTINKAAGLITATSGTTMALNAAVNKTGSGDVTFNGGSTFTSAAAGDITSSAGGSVNISAGTGALNASGFVNISGGGRLNMSSGAATTINAGADITISGTSAATTLVQAGTGIAMNANYSNTTTAGVTTFNAALTGSGVLNIGAGTTFTHMTNGNCNLSASATGADITIGGVFTAFNGTTALGNLNMTFDDDFTLAATGSINFNAPGFTWTFTGTALTGTAANFMGPVTVVGNTNWSTAGGSISLNGATSINGTANWSTTGGAFNINDGLTVTGTGTLTVTGNGGNVVTGIASNVNYTSTGDLLFQTTGAGFDITIGNTAPNSFTVTSANATFWPEDDSTLSAGATLNFSAAGKTLLYQSGSTTTHNFNGAVNVTGGNMTVSASDDIIIATTTGSIFYNVPGGTLMFTSFLTDPDFTLNGTLNVQNGNLFITTVDDIAFGGASTFIFNSSDPIVLNATGTTGSIAWNGNSTISANAGPLTMFAQADFALGGASVTNYLSNSPWVVTAATGNIIFGGNTTIATNASFTATGLGNATVDGFFRSIAGGNITVTCGGNFILGAAADTNASQFGGAGGTTTLNVGGGLFIASGLVPGATATLGVVDGVQKGPMILNVTGIIEIEANRNEDAAITAPGTLTIGPATGGALNIVTDTFPGQTGRAFIQTGDTCYIERNNLLMIGSNDGGAAFIQTQNGKLTILNQTDADVGDNAFIQNTGVGKLFLVVDQQAPFPPQVGDGSFSLADQGFLSTNGGDLSIFTALPELNEVRGLINGATLNEGHQFFGVWFSTFPDNDPPPFSIYYKVGGGSTEVVNQMNVAIAEMLQEGFYRTMGWRWREKFWTCINEELDEYSNFSRTPFEYPLLEAPDAFECGGVLFEEPIFNNLREY